MTGMTDAEAKRIAGLITGGSVALRKLACETAVERAGLPAFEATTILLKLDKVADEDLPEALEQEIAERVKADPQLALSLKINETLEVKAFDEGNMTALGQLHIQYAKYGSKFLDERRAARKSAATDETIKKADAIVERDEHKNPFDPLTKFGSETVRQNEIVKFIRFFGAKAAAKAAAKYGTDLAGRPLARRA